MSERYQPAEFPESKFRSKYDESLYLMGLDGVISEGGGEVHSPMGWFFRLAILPRDYADVADLYAAELETLGVDVAALIGFHILRETVDGVQHYRYLTSDAMNADFAALTDVYAAWKQSHEPEEPF